MRMKLNHVSFQREMCKKKSLLVHAKELPAEALLQFKCCWNRWNHKESIECAISCCTVHHLSKMVRQVCFPQITEVWCGLDLRLKVVFVPCAMKMLWSPSATATWQGGSELVLFLFLYQFNCVLNFSVDFQLCCSWRAWSFLFHVPAWLLAQQY